MSAARAQSVNQAGLRRNEQKWSRELLAAGWSLIPNVLLERQRVLQLDSTDLNILLHLVKHWWFADNLPHPSKQSIAECMGVDPSTVRRRIAKLEKRKLVKRIPRNSRQFGRRVNRLACIEPMRHVCGELQREATVTTTMTRRKRSPTLTPLNHFMTLGQSLSRTFEEEVETPISSDA